MNSVSLLNTVVTIPISYTGFLFIWITFLAMFLSAVCYFVVIVKTPSQSSPGGSYLNPRERSR